MQLTDTQYKGLLTIKEKFLIGAKRAVISGYAGTGKSTLVRFIIEELPGVDPLIDVCYAAYTGKACQVLKDKGNPNVSTLHRLLFESIPKPDGTFFRKRKPSIEYKIVVIDEASMVPKDFVEILDEYPIFTIWLGDPFQLPPVDKNSANNLLDRPDVMLTQIMRQEAESDIIRLSMDIREGRPLDYYHGNDAIVISKSELNTGMLQWADIILCGTNKTRIALNNQMRDLLGHHGSVAEGEKLIALRNYWDDIATNDDPLINGTIGYASHIFENFIHYPKYLHDGPDIQLIMADFTSEIGGKYGQFAMDKQNILTGVYSLNNKEKFKIGKNPRYSRSLPKEFTYGYAITAHKAQGSEWDRVLVIEEKFPFDKMEHARWLYTAVTRASQKLVLVR